LLALALELALALDSELAKESAKESAFLRYTANMKHVLTLEYFHLYLPVCLEFHNSVRQPLMLLNQQLILMMILIQCMCLHHRHIL
jgi:hypothetical protein